MRSFLSLVAAVAMIAGAAPAASAAEEVPPVIGYHSVVYDEGGNPIRDGDWNVLFRILDEEGLVLYEESQRLPAVGGQISALIGNGLDEHGAPTGGVPLEIMAPGSGRYLDVVVEGMEPLPIAELASVPYAGYAQIALGVARGSVAFDALASSAVEGIAKELTGGEGKDAIVLRHDLDTAYSGSGGASAIGVATAGIDNSSSTDLQAVLGDLDTAISHNSQQIQAEAAMLAQQIQAEASTRNQQIQAEASTRNQQIQAEAAARQQADAQRLLRTGDTMNGTLTMNGNIVMGTGYKVDGYDVGVEFSRLIGRTSGFSRLIWGSLTAGGVNPTIVGADVAVSYCGAYCYDISFLNPMPSSSYAVVLTLMNSHKSTDGSVAAPYSITNKQADGFRVMMGMVSAPLFDFIAIGN